MVLKALGEMGELAVTEYSVRGADVSYAPYGVELNNLTWKLCCSIESLIYPDS